MKSERCEIAILLSKNYQQKDIARALGRSVSTISDELKRNKVKGKYNPKRAHRKARIRRQNAKFQGRKIAANKELREFVEYHLLNDQSPRAISGRLKHQEKNLPYVSKDSICRYIKSPYGRKIEYYRQKNRRRRRNGRRKSKLEKLKNRTFIDERPKIFGNRRRVGHTEADFIVSGRSGKGIILVIIDRKLRTAFLKRIINTKIENIHLAFLATKKRFPEMKSVTTDNDILLQKHKELEGLLGIKIYFCHPYSAWEKGSIENANGVIRRHIPKSSDISKYSDRSIKEIEVKLNNRILKCLNYLTPREKLERYRRNKKADSTNSD